MIKNLAQVLREHQAWLRREPGGVQADLWGENLWRARLRRADLRGADLWGASRLSSRGHPLYEREKVVEL